MTDKTAPVSSGCSHCDSSVPHKHLDVPTLVDKAARRSRLRSTMLPVTSALVMVAAVALAAWPGDVALTLGVIGLTVVAWAVSVTLAVIVSRAATGSRGPVTGVLAGRLTSAVTAPIAGLVVGVAVAGPATVAWLVGVASGATWLLMTSLTEWLAARHWRTLLWQEGEDGEQARAQAVTSAQEPERFPVAWLVTGLSVALALWLAVAIGWWVGLLAVPLSLAVTSQQSLAERRRS